MTVLSETTQRLFETPGGILLLLCIIFVASALILISYKLYKIGLIIFCLSLLMVVIAFLFFMPPHRKIKVTISEDYPAIELLNKYYVDENDGDIWTLTEKEPIEVNK